MIEGLACSRSIHNNIHRCLDDVQITVSTRIRIIYMYIIRILVFTSNSRINLQLWTTSACLARDIWQRFSLELGLGLTVASSEDNGNVCVPRSSRLHTSVILCMTALRIRQNRYNILWRIATAWPDRFWRKENTFRELDVLFVIET